MAVKVAAFPLVVQQSMPVTKVHFLHQIEHVVARAKRVGLGRVGRVGWCVELTECNLVLLAAASDLQVCRRKKELE